jgi:hypothetical protein
MRRTLTAAGLLLLTTNAVQALDISLGVRNESTHTDNTARTADNEVDEWVHTPGTELFVEHQSQRLVVNGNYEYEKRIRSEDLFEDESVLTGTSNLTWHILPGRLDFTVANARTETTAQAQLAQNPDNQQVSMSTRAGPTLRFRTRGADEFQLQFLYTDERNEAENTDASRETATAAYVWNPGNNDRVTFSALSNTVDFEDELAPDYDGYTTSVQWERFGPSIDFRALAGYTAVERDLGRDDVSNTDVQLGLAWRMTPTMTLSLDAARDLRDRSATLELGVIDFGTNTQIDSELNEVFINTRAALTWDMRLWDNRIVLGVTYDDEDYDDVFNDIERRALQFSFERRLSPRFDLLLAGFVGEENFIDAGTEFDRLSYEIALRYNPNRRLSMLFGAAHDERESDLVPDQNYEEDTYGVTIQYMLLE